MLALKSRHLRQVVACCLFIQHSLKQSDEQAIERIKERKKWAAHKLNSYRPTPLLATQTSRNIASVYCVTKLSLDFVTAATVSVYV